MAGQLLRRTMTMTMAVLAGWLIDPAAAANRYVELRSAAVKRCEAIDPS